MTEPSVQPFRDRAEEPLSRTRLMRGASLLGVATLAFSLLAGFVQPPPAEAAPYGFNRIAGGDRYSTSVEVSKAMPAGKVDVVYLAAGDKFPDALTAAPVAYGTGGRLLLTDSGSLQGSTAAELKRLSPSRVVIVGGTSTISDGVLREVRQVTGVQVTRVAGADRVQTSLELFKVLNKDQAVTDVWVTDGQGFADSLTVSAIAARKGHAIVLALGDPKAWMAAFSKVVPSSARIHIAGGTPSVPATYESLLRERHPSVSRVAGANRWDTSYRLNQKHTPSISGNAIYLASGEKFPSKSITQKGGE